MTEKQFDPKMLNALDLAFVGDGVYGLLVREMLARDGSRPVGELHRMAVAYVNATAQAEERRGAPAQKRRPRPLCQGDRTGGAVRLPAPVRGAAAAAGAFCGDSAGTE